VIHQLLLRWPTFEVLINRWLGKAAEVIWVITLALVKNRVRSVPFFLPALAISFIAFVGLPIVVMFERADA
jgi:hypothetical protein